MRRTKSTIERLSKSQYVSGQVIISTMLRAYAFQGSVAEMRGKAYRRNRSITKREVSVTTCNLPPLTPCTRRLIFKNINCPRVLAKIAVTPKSWHTGGTILFKTWRGNVSPFII